MKSIFSVGPVESEHYVIEANDEMNDDGTYEIMESEDGTTVPLYWSNEDGWVPYYFCDRFDEQDVKDLDAPLGGAWKKAYTITSFVMSDSGQYNVNEYVQIERCV